MRRHPDVGWTKRASDLVTLSALQSRMLDRAATLLRPGGRLVYCTCSIEPEEGEMQIAALLRRNPDLVRSPIAAEEIGGLTASITALGEVADFALSSGADRASDDGTRRVLRGAAFTQVLK